MTKHKSNRDEKDVLGICYCRDVGCLFLFGILGKWEIYLHKLYVSKFLFNEYPITDLIHYIAPD